MKVLYGALVIAAVIIGAFVGVKVLKSKEKKSCFDWNYWLEKETKICDDCKKNNTEKIDLENCYFGYQPVADPEGRTINQTAFLIDVLKNFSGDDETRAAIEKDLLEICTSKKIKTREQQEGVFRCEVGTFAKHCPEADEKFREWAYNPGIKDCDGKTNNIWRNNP